MFLLCKNKNKKKSRKFNIFTVRFAPSASEQKVKERREDEGGEERWEASRCAGTAVPPQHESWGHTVSSHPTSYTDSLGWGREEDAAAMIKQNERGTSVSDVRRGCCQQLLWWRVSVLPGNNSLPFVANILFFYEKELFDAVIFLNVPLLCEQIQRRKPSCQSGFWKSSNLTGRIVCFTKPSGKLQLENNW